MEKIFGKRNRNRRTSLVLKFDSVPDKLKPGLVDVKVFFAGKSQSQLESASVGSLTQPLFTLPGDKPQSTTTRSPGTRPNDAEPRLEDIKGLIREWISSARPVENAKPGVNLRFTEYGVLVGTTPTGTIRANAPPDESRSFASPEAYLWARRQELDSLNLCKLGVYVRTRLAGKPLSNCSRGGQTPQTLADFEAKCRASNRSRSFVSSGAMGKMSVSTANLAMNRIRNAAAKRLRNSLPIAKRVTAPILPRGRGRRAAYL